MTITYEKRSSGRCTEVGRRKRNEHKESQQAIGPCLSITKPGVRKKVEDVWLKGVKACITVVLVGIQESHKEEYLD